MGGSRSRVIHGRRTMKQRPEGLVLSCGMKIVRYELCGSWLLCPAVGIDGRLREGHVKDRYTVLDKEGLPLDKTHLNNKHSLRILRTAVFMG